jgi:serine protease Do
MKKLLILFVILILSGCTMKTETEYVVDEETKQKLIEQLKEELKNEFIIEYQPSLSDIENMILTVVENNGKSLIGVTNLKKVKPTEAVSGYITQGTGSGVIYDYQDGYYYAITNAHVVDGADSVKVVLEDETTLDVVTIYGTKLYVSDQQSDIAVIKFPYDQNLKVAQFYDSEMIQKGQIAVAMGNPLGYEYFGSVTMGIVSGLSRGIDIDYNGDNVIDWKANLIQHDVAISPGNSGGPLFDLNGRVIGINNMKIVEDNVSNIGFAIPANTAIEIATILREKGSVSRAKLGITGNDIATLRDNPINNIPAEVKGGVYISTISPGGTVDGTGIQVGDIIQEFNGAPIVEFDDLRYQLDNSYVGDEVTLKVYRSGQLLEFEITLKELPNQ